jgi:hypothetical protein
VANANAELANKDLTETGTPDRTDDEIASPGVTEPVSEAHDYAAADYAAPEFTEPEIATPATPEPETVVPESDEPDPADAPIEAEILEPDAYIARPSQSSPQTEILGPEDTPEPQQRNTGFNIFAAPTAERAAVTLQRFADSFSSDQSPEEPATIDATAERDPDEGPRPPWERPDGPMPDYSASARVRVGLDPFPKAATPKADPAPDAGAAVPGTVLTDDAGPKTASQSRFQELLQRVNSNAEEPPAQVEEDTATESERPDLSASDIAAKAGGENTVDLLAASAAWLTIYQKTPQFTRREVMQVFDTIPGDHARTLEARIKGYGKLLRSGTIQLVDDGVFAMSPEAVASFEDIIQRS